MADYNVASLSTVSGNMDIIGPGSGNPGGGDHEDNNHDSDFEVSMWWTNHDSGSHSDLKVRVKLGDNKVNGVHVTIYFVDGVHNIYKVSNVSRGTVTYVSNVLDIVCTDEVSGNFETQFQIIFTPGPFKENSLKQAGIPDQSAFGSYKFPLDGDARAEIRIGWSSATEGDEVVSKKEACATAFAL